MKTRALARIGFALSSVAFLVAAPLAWADPAPLAAPVIPGWTLKSDTDVSRGQIDTIEGKLKGKIKTLRNLVYEVNGKKVQINLVVPRDSTEAGKIYHSLTAMKPTWSVVQKPDLIYELVGQNDVMEEMKKAHDLLEKS